MRKSAALRNGLPRRGVTVGTAERSCATMGLLYPASKADILKHIYGLSDEDRAEFEKLPDITYRNRNDIQRELSRGGRERGNLRSYVGDPAARNTGDAGGTEPSHEG